MVHARGPPEHGRELLPFKTGAFRRALAAQVPIVPVVAAPLGVCGTRSHAGRPGVLRVTILEPVPTDTPDPRSVAELAATVRSTMQEELDRLAGGS